jgi:hypothetical protein
LRLTQPISTDSPSAAIDLLDAAEQEPRAVPPDLARRLVRDRDQDVAAKVAKLLHVIADIDERKRIDYHMPFGI